MGDGSDTRAGMVAGEGVEMIGFFSAVGNGVFTRGAGVNSFLVSIGSRAVFMGNGAVG